MLGRLQFRRIGRQKDQAQALGDFEMRTGVPAGAIEYQDDAFVLAGPDGSGEALEHGGEQHQVDGGAQEPLDGAATGVNETVEVEPLIAEMGGGHGPLALLGPYPAQHRLQTGAMLVDRPTPRPPGPAYGRALRRLCR